MPAPEPCVIVVSESYTQARRWIVHDLGATQETEGAWRFAGLLWRIATRENDFRGHRFIDVVRVGPLSQRFALLADHYVENRRAKPR